jgi:hypothetical protein
VEKLAKAKDIPTLVTHAATGRMQESEIRADMIAHVPSLEVLFDKWRRETGADLSTFQLTAVGIAIGHACHRKVVGGVGALDIFLL